MSDRILPQVPAAPGFGWIPCPLCAGIASHCPHCSWWGVVYGRVVSE